MGNGYMIHNSRPSSNLNFMKNNAYNRVYGLVKANFNILTKSDMSALTILSSAGLGKTTLVLKTMKELGYKEGEHYLYFNSYFTPLAFYQTLIEVQELPKMPKILILDDVETILRNRDIINLLKSATWDSGHGRIVNYISTSNKVKQKTLNFTGKIILLINETPEANLMFKAIVDRVLFCELSFSQQDILSLMEEEIVSQPFQTLTINQRRKVFEFIKRNVKPETDLSFRVLVKAFNFFAYTPAHWQDMTSQLLKSSLIKKSGENKKAGLF
jgi:hypothetical protein